jgi:hypothetical protein
MDSVAASAFQADEDAVSERPWSIRSLGPSGQSSTTAPQRSDRRQAPGAREQPIMDLIGRLSNSGFRALLHSLLE